jgi:alkanesulfonate monooxygenase SsuD/methylene tetrahydromethanopterin reductase-like flavin-dependent oxidoreductase (luciferase family)
MVTPLARRRPVTAARETTTLDQLSGGRLLLGAGLGDDVAAYAHAGATWWLTDLEAEALTISRIRAVIDDPAC